MKIQKQKLLILNGSPRKNGNTSIVVELLKKELKKKYATEQLDLYPMQIKGCAHCDACKKNLIKPGCVLRDEGITVLKKIHAADIIAFANPVYCWSFPGCTSAVLDRFYSMFKHNDSSLIKSKKIIGVFTSGGDRFEGMDLCVSGLKQLAAYGQAEYVGTLDIIYCDQPKVLWQNKSLKPKIKKFVASL